MTVCIAGIAGDASGASLIMCSDTRVETGLAGGDILPKHGSIADKAAFMIAGGLADANAMIDSYTQYLLEHEVPDNPCVHINFLSVLARNAKDKRMNDFVWSRLGISLEKFYALGTKQLGNVFYEITAGLLAVDLGCEMILALPAGLSWTLCKVDFSGAVTRGLDFAVIGAGTSIAEAVLYQRCYSLGNCFDACLYSIYEAKRLSEIAPGVGHETWLTVKEHDHKRGGVIKTKLVTIQGRAALAQMYSTYGPKTLDGEIQFPMHLLGEI